MSKYPQIIAAWDSWIKSELTDAEVVVDLAKLLSSITIEAERFMVWSMISAITKNNV